MRKLQSKLLTSKADEIGARYHGNVGQGEDEDVLLVESICASKLIG
jgi:hypothetical protein